MPFGNVPYLRARANQTLTDTVTVYPYPTTVTRSGTGGEKVGYEGASTTLACRKMPTQPSFMFSGFRDAITGAQLQIGEHLVVLCEIGANIIEGQEVEADGKRYTVQGISDHGTGFALKAVLMRRAGRIRNR